MRTENAVKNIYFNLLTQIAIILLGFFSRKVFIDNLGIEYLGINGLLTNVLSMLSLVEGGIGVSIIYSLYKPIAEGNKNEVIALVQLYKRLYGILSITVLLLSMVLYPFIDIFIKDGAKIPYLFLVYDIFVAKNVISYLNAHKWSLINADQKGYVLAKYNLVFNIITTILKIIILKATKNYVLFLIVDIVVFTVQNIWNGKIVNNRYPYIKTKTKYSIEKQTRKNIVNNVKALFLHNIGGYCVFGTDNILISACINLSTVGLYSNYTMIITQLSSLLNPIFNSIGDSIGNLIATESKEKQYHIFSIIYLINFWIYSMAVIFLYNLLEPFINWWLGKGLILDRFTFLIILINFYITGLRNSASVFRNKAGIFTPDRYMPLVESLINLVSSLILVRYLGLAGIFIGTTISSISIPLWIPAKIVYNRIFNKSVFNYVSRYICYIVVTVICGVITTILCGNISFRNELVNLILKGLICVIVPNIIYILIFFKSKEFQYLLSSLKGILNRKISKSVVSS